MERDRGQRNERPWYKNGCLLLPIHLVRYSPQIIAHIRGNGSESLSDPTIAAADQALANMDVTFPEAVANALCLRIGVPPVVDSRKSK